MITARKIRTKFNILSVRKKIQVILAVLMTAALLVSLPVLAWFNYQRRIVRLQKIEAPNTLILSAA